MRVLTRLVDEGVVIGDHVHVTVLEIHDDHVRLGISCPRAEAPETCDYWEEIVSVKFLENAPEPLESVPSLP